MFHDKIWIARRLLCGECVAGDRSGMGVPVTQVQRLVIKVGIGMGNWQWKEGEGEGSEKYAGGRRVRMTW